MPTRPDPLLDLLFTIPELQLVHTIGTLQLDMIVRNSALQVFRQAHQGSLMKTSKKYTSNNLLLLTRYKVLGVALEIMYIRISICSPFE